MYRMKLVSMVFVNVELHVLAILEVLLEVTVIQKIANANVRLQKIFAEEI